MSLAATSQGYHHLGSEAIITGTGSMPGRGPMPLRLAVPVTVITNAGDSDSPAASGPGLAADYNAVYTEVHLDIMISPRADALTWSPISTAKETSA